MEVARVGRSGFPPTVSRRPPRAAEIPFPTDANVKVARCPKCGAPTPPYTKTCAWCGGTLPSPPPGPLSSRPLPSQSSPIQDATELVIRGEGGIRELFRVENESGILLAEGSRSTEGLVGMMEVVMTDPAGGYLLAFRLAHLPGHPVPQAAIPYLAVDDQGQPIGELHQRMVGLIGHSYELWSQGEALLTVSSASRSQPYPLLMRGTPVATITEAAPRLGLSTEGSWTVRFNAPCPHLPVLALATYVAASRGRGGVPLR